MAKGKKVIDGALNFLKGWGNNLNANKTVGSAITKDLKNARRTSTKLKKTAGVTKDADEAADLLKSAAEATAKGDSARDVGKFMKGRDQSTSEAIESYRNSRRGNAARIKGSELGTLDKIGSDLGTAKSLAGSYFMGGSAAQNATRIGTAAGGVMGVSLAGRGLTGGSLTKNNKGERDIAGIPFL